MPTRVTLSKTSPLQDSVRAAHEALETGRTVSVGSQGNLEVTDITEAGGGTFFGKAVRYVKNCFSPYRARRQNHAVIAVLNEQISREFGPDHRLNIRTVLRRADTNERFLQSIISNVGKVRAGTEYTPATDTRDEIRNTLRYGFAGKVTGLRPACTLQEALLREQQGQSLPAAGETGTARAQLFWYNRTMNDLFTRFPKLRDISAISSLDLDAVLKCATIFAAYDRATHGMKFAPVDIEEKSREVVSCCIAGQTTPKQDFSGYIHHEYAHHLSVGVVPEKVWIPELVDALKAGGISNVSITNVSGKPKFDPDTAEKIANSISKYAAINARECAAEIISWYMNPEYGNSVGRMPDYLEHWVTECFPMLNND